MYITLSKVLVGRLLNGLRKWLGNIAENAKPDTNQETSHKMAFVAFVTWSARTCVPYHPARFHATWTFIQVKTIMYELYLYTCTYSLSFRTEWVTPVPDFREDLALRYRIFNHPIFHLRSEANSLLPKRFLRLPKPHIWPRPRQPLRTPTQTVLYIIFKPLKYEFSRFCALKNFHRQRNVMTFFMQGFMVV